MAFRRRTSLPCKVSKSITLRLHPDIYEALKKEAGDRTLEKGKHITIGDVIREIIEDDDSHFTKQFRVPKGASSAPKKCTAVQLVFPFV